MFNRELIIGLLTLGLAFFMLVRTEYRTWVNNNRDLVEGRIDGKQAEEQIHKKMGEDVSVSFQQELYDRYYFQVNDPKNDSTYDVYVNNTHPKVKMLRKANNANF